MKVLRSFVYAWNGLRVCFQTQVNFKVHLFFAAIAILLGINFHITVTEWLVVTICIAIVLVAEMLNTAIEKLCDVVHKDIHPGIKLVKDISAGAVLVAALMSVVAGVVIFFPKILLFIKSL